MTDTHENTTHLIETESARLPALPLKAERIQWILLVLDLGRDSGNRPYDFSRETKAERNARLEAGWRKRTADSTSRASSQRLAA